MKTTSRFAILFVVLAAIALSAQAAGDKYQITTLSSRPDMVAGGDVLLQVDVPANAAANTVVKLNGQDVSSSLHATQDGHALVGLVSGLHVGDNKLEVFSGPKGKPVAVANLKDYPITGPIFSGPQEHPFICQTDEFKMPDKTTLGAPLDDNCSVKTMVSYVYKSTEPPPAPARGGRGGAGLGGNPPMNLKPLTDMSTLPADVAYTTTTTGDKVPFVIRVETGTINRGIYQFAVLSDPTKEPASQIGPLNPPKEWNKRLLYSFGAGCPGGWFKQGNNLGMSNGVLNEDVVGKGYAEISSSLNVFVNNCNEVIAAETMMMTKERFIKSYGPPDFTFSRGGSGGSEQQLPIADAYPGLLDGIIPSMTFPDVLTNLQNTYDTALLNAYFEKAGSAYTEDQRLAVTGTAKLRDAAADISRVDPRQNCFEKIPQSERYNPDSNRTGARCDLFDHDANIFGRDPSTGFARRTLDNTGVQYGLAALNAGKITPAEFIDLNQKIGGYDNDGSWMTGRNAADPVALKRAYDTDHVTEGFTGLAKVPIIDVRPYRDMLPPAGDVHQKYYSFALRDRLQRNTGTYANDVILVEPVEAYNSVGEYAVTEMDEWLTNIKKDNSNMPLEKKIAQDKPADLVDSCYPAGGDRIKEPQTFTGGTCNDSFRTYGSPRMVAGDPIGNDVVKCQLKPLSRSDYKVQFSDQEWSQVQGIFASGVCDWSKPGVDQHPPTGTWVNYSEPSDQGKLSGSGQPSALRQSN